MERDVEVLVKEKKDNVKVTIEEVIENNHEDKEEESKEKKGMDLMKENGKQLTSSPAGTSQSCHLKFPITEEEKKLKIVDINLKLPGGLKSSHCNVAMNLGDPLSCTLDGGENESVTEDEVFNELILAILDEDTKKISKTVTKDIIINHMLKMKQRVKLFKIIEEKKTEESIVISGPREQSTRATESLIQNTSQNFPSDDYTYEEVDMFMDILQFCVHQYKPRALKVILQALKREDNSMTCSTLKNSRVRLNCDKHGNHIHEDFRFEKQNIFHLAANGHFDCLEILLDEIKNNQDPLHAKDFCKRTPLHIAACSSTLDCLVMLFDAMDSVQCLEQKDSFGKNSLHYAVEHGSLDNIFFILTKIRKTKLQSYVNERNADKRSPIFFAKDHKSLYLLLLYGADPTLVDNSNISVLEHFLRLKPDNAEALLNFEVDTNGKDINDKNFLYTYNFRLFLQEEESGPDKKKFAKRKARPELRIVNKFSEYKQDGLLSTPLAELYIYSKWNVTKYMYYFNCFVHMLYLILLTLLVFWSSHDMYHTTEEMTKRSCKFQDIDFKLYHKSAIDLWTNLYTVTYFFTLVLTVKCLWQLSSKEFKIKINGMVLIKFGGLFFSLFYMSYGRFAEKVSCKGMTITSALALFLTWIQLSFLLGEQPKLGIYIVMSKNILKQLGQFFVVYLPTLMAFACTFSIILPTSEIFQNIVMSNLKVIVMMVGEFNFEDRIKHKEHMFEDETSSIYTLMVIFFFCVLMVNFLGNLMMGMVVQNVSELKKEAETYMITETLENMQETEQTFFHSQFFQWLMRMFPDLKLESHLEFMPYLKRKCKPDEDFSEIILCMSTEHNSVWYKPLGKKYRFYFFKDGKNQAYLNISTPSWLVENTKVARATKQKIFKELIEKFEEYKRKVKEWYANNGKSKENGSSEVENLFSNI